MSEKREAEPSNDQIEKKSKVAFDLIEVKENFQQINQGVEFPVVLKPKQTGSTATEAIEWASTNNEKIEALCAKYGAVLFRGLNLNDKQEFHDFICAVKRWDWVMEAPVGGGGPRNKVIGPVHTSTESPAEFYIPFHHELAYINAPPSKLVFYCSLPSADPADKKGGETPILNSNNVFLKIKQEKPEFVEKIIAKGVKYIRVLQDRKDCTNKYQRCWQDVFKSDSRQGAEEGAKASGHESIEWLENGAMKVRSIKFDGIRVDKRTGVSTWFNAIVLLHPAAHAETKVDSLWNVTYGDDSAIDDDDVKAAKRIMDAEGMCFKYEKNDVLLVDNWLALHARNPFTPPRLILAAMVK